jgi:predicted ribonuclease YlaK
LGYRLFLDTNALLNLQDKAFNENFVISQKTLEELEDIKSSSKKDGEVKHKARKIARLLDINDGNYTVIRTDSKVKDCIKNFDLDETPDNIILASAYIFNENENVIVVSDDINVKFISRNIFNLLTKGIDELSLVESEEYTGYKEIVMSDNEMSYFYSNIDKNIYGLLINQYLVIQNEAGEIIDNRRWDGTTHKAMSYKQINNDFFGRVKPRNNAQVLSFDMLQNKEETIKILSGRWGSGKDFLMISNALELIKQGKYDRLVYIRNAIGISDAQEIGFLPGDMQEKLAPFTAALADHLGGQQGLEFQMMQGNIVVEHLGFIRGRTYLNSIVYVSEAENLTKDHVQLLISRIGEGSTLWMNGDYKQTDSHIFRMNNGLMSAINCLKGHPRFGFVKLNKTERSETAEMAELLD